MSLLLTPFKLHVGFDTGHDANTGLSVVMPWSLDLALQPSERLYNTQQTTHNLASVCSPHLSIKYEHAVRAYQIACCLAGANEIAVPTKQVPE